MRQIRWANEKQRWLFERGHKPTLLAGGQNSGKSVGCVLKLLSLLQTYPGSRAAVVRRAYTQLTKTTMETFFQWCTPEFYRSRGSFNANSGVLDLNNGSRVYFLHLDQPNSLDVLAGLELNFVYVSQAEEISEKAWDLLDVRTGRWTGTEVPTELLNSYPGGREAWPWKSEDGTVVVPPRYIFAEGYVTDELHWLYRRFAPESPEREKWAALGYESQIVDSDENIFANKAVTAALLAKDDDYVRRYVRPVWGNAEGAIFKIDELSIIDPDRNPGLLQKILTTMRLHRSLDHGETAPTCCGWHATDSEGDIFTYREYYAADLLVSDHRRAIFELSKADAGQYVGVVPNYHSDLADPSIFAKSRGRTVNQGPRWSVADEYTDTKVMPKETVIHWRPADNGEEVTRSRLKEYLRVDPLHKHPITGELGAPRLYFIKKTPRYPNGCDMVLKEIRAQRRVEIMVVGDKKVFGDDRDPTVVDHGYDMEKYFVVSRPSPGDASMLPAPPPGQMRVSDYNRMVDEQKFRQRREERRQGVTGGY